MLGPDPKQIATETISTVLIQDIPPEHHIQNIIFFYKIRGKGPNLLIRLIN